MTCLALSSCLGRIGRHIARVRTSYYGAFCDKSEGVTTPVQAGSIAPLLQLRINKARQECTHPSV